MPSHKQDGKPRTALILYGSETGNAQDVAEEIGRLTIRLHFDTTVLDLDSVTLRECIKYTVVIFALSTTGQGEFPQNARQFWKTLLSGALKAGSLKKIRFTSFGLGDSSYARYNVAHRMLCGRLSQLGAHMFCERGEGNETHPEGHSAGFREWILTLKNQLLDVFPLGEGMEPLREDEFLEPKWKLHLQELKEPGKQSVSQANGNPSHQAPTTNGIEHSPVDIPSQEMLPIKAAHPATLLSNTRITSSDHIQDVRLLSFHIPTRQHYRPGAIAIIHPKNFPSDVETFIDLMSWQAIADVPLTLLPTSDHNTPSPLRYLDLSSVHLTLRWLLENVLDIMSIPRRSFFANLLHFASIADETAAYQKERLVELANPELIDELWDYTTRPKRTILEVMTDFTSIQIPWQYVLTTLPLMKGRQFSITSGGHLRHPEISAEGTRVQLLVAIADPPSPIIKHRRRYGVCTRYIATLTANQQLRIGLHPGYLDVQPSSMDVPVIMIGPGTGLAPLRSLVWQRMHWAQDLALRPAGKGLEHDILIFGFRDSEGDFFFRKEWDQLQRDEGLILLTAVSRDKNQPRMYVQDRIRLNGKRIVETLLEDRGKIYVCGSSGNMPKGVREALVDILVDAGKMGSKEDADAYLDVMEKEGRYKQETW